ncbi:MAG: exodeoxyribonuclease VII small subunit [Bacteroidales bacterium]|nr:exodeoxyribonuclease VII small subunit [Bacteroidales bacterium]
MAENKKPTYTEAYDELQEIVRKMENADISVDELTKNIERASFLIQICKEKLGKTEEEVNKIIADSTRVG